MPQSQALCSPAFSLAIWPHRFLEAMSFPSWGAGRCCPQVSLFGRPPLLQRLCLPAASQVRFERLCHFLWTLSEQPHGAFASHCLLGRLSCLQSGIKYEAKEYKLTSDSVKDGGLKVSTPCRIADSNSGFVAVEGVVYLNPLNRSPIKRCGHPIPCRYLPL